MIFLGAVSNVPLVWEMADFFNGIMALVNLVVILLLSGIAREVFADYVKRFNAGELDPKADPAFIKKFAAGRKWRQFANLEKGGARQ
ncbi:MAG: alanine:cation symporter family protein [Synergistaceae bacterium]|jgi:AGCS family alanine or glycine:cation symporter|nr:alanine:cation symporter family protein [Synergistaceae bacterium]